jgi:hypothetical protein
MPIRIEEMNTEVIAESPGQLAGTDAAPAGERDDELSQVKFALATAQRLAQRLAAEGYDD